MRKSLLMVFGVIFCGGSLLQAQPFMGWSPVADSKRSIQLREQIVKMDVQIRRMEQQIDILNTIRDDQKNYMDNYFGDASNYGATQGVREFEADIKSSKDAPVGASSEETKNVLETSGIRDLMEKAEGSDMLKGNESSNPNSYSIYGGVGEYFVVDGVERARNPDLYKPEAIMKKLVEAYNGVKDEIMKRRNNLRAALVKANDVAQKADTFAELQKAQAAITAIGAQLQSLEFELRQMEADSNNARLLILAEERAGLKAQAERQAEEVKVGLEKGYEHYQALPDNTTLRWERGD